MEWEDGPYAYHSSHPLMEEGGGGRTCLFLRETFFSLEENLYSRGSPGSYPSHPLVEEGGGTRLVRLPKGEERVPKNKQGQCSRGLPGSHASHPLVEEGGGTKLVMLP